MGIYTYKILVLNLLIPCLGLLRNSGFFLRDPMNYVSVEELRGKARN